MNDRRSLFVGDTEGSDECVAPKKLARALFKAWKNAPTDQLSPQVSLPHLSCDAVLDIRRCFEERVCERRDTSSRYLRDESMSEDVVPTKARYTSTSEILLDVSRLCCLCEVNVSSVRPTEQCILAWAHRLQVVT